jgi:ABC-type transport system involved in multi-copper enzyme maturation permease subunit
MFKNTFAIENTKNMKRKLLWVELAVFILLMIVAYCFIYFSFLSSPARIAIPTAERANLAQMVTWPGSLTGLLHTVGGSGLGPLMIIIFIGAVTAQEYTWRTFHLWLSRGTPRPLLLVAKFTALLVPILVIILTTLISGAVLTAIFSFMINGTLNINQVNLPLLLVGVARTVFTLLPYAGLTFFLAVASRSTVVAVGVSLAYALLFENILMQVMGLLGETMGRLSQFLPAALANRLMLINQTAIGVENIQPIGSLTPLVALLGTIAWIAFFLGLSLVIFQRQDLNN